MEAMEVFIHIPGLWEWAENDESQLVVAVIAEGAGTGSSVAVPLPIRFLINIIINLNRKSLHRFSKRGILNTMKHNADRETVFTGGLAKWLKQRAVAGW